MGSLYALSNRFCATSKPFWCVAPDIWNFLLTALARKRNQKNGGSVPLFTEPQAAPQYKRVKGSPLITVKRKRIDMLALFEMPVVQLTIFMTVIYGLLKLAFVVLLEDVKRRYPDVTMRDLQR